MQQIRNKSKSILLQTQFQATYTTTYSTLWYSFILSFHLISLVFTVIQKLPTPIQLILPYSTIFIFISISFALFVIVSLLAIFKKVMLSFWCYALLFFQGISSFCLQVAIKCYTNQKWCNGDIKYQILVIIVSVIMFLTVIILRTFNYYPLYDVTNMHSMTNGFIVPLLFIYKLILVFIFNISNLNDIQLHKALFFFLSLALFSIGYNKYYNHFITKSFWNIIYAITLWTSTIIYIIPNLQSISFNKDNFDSIQLSKYIWYYSIVFLIIFTLGFQKKPKWSDFFINLHKIDKQIVIFQKIGLILYTLNKIKLSDDKFLNKNYKILLELMQKHKQQCKYINCHINQMQKQLFLHKDQKMQIKRMNKNIDLCFKVCSELLQQLLIQYPNTQQIIIFIANFHLQAFRIKTKALSLGNDRKTKLNFDSYYSIFYIKSKIQMQNKQKIQLNKQMIQSQINNFQHNIEVSVSMLTQFWYLLSDPKCNLKKLYDLANVLFPLKIEVDNMWKKIQGFKNLDSYSLYARYLIQIFNDKQKGLKILQQAKKIQLQNRNKKQLNLLLENSKIVDPDGILFCQLDQYNTGKIYQYNLSIQKMFSYQKGEMLDRKVNDIMPKLIAIYHDRILQNFKLTNKVRVLNKQRIVFGKSKLGYIFPVNIIVKPVRNFYNQRLEVYGCIKSEQITKQTIYFIVDKNNYITDISASAIHIFPLLNPIIITKKRIGMKQIIPNFDDLMLNNLQTLDVQIVHNYEVDEEILQQKIWYTLYINDIHISIFGDVGYEIKMVRKFIKNEQQNHLTETQHKKFSLCLDLNFEKTLKVNFIGIEDINLEYENYLQGKNINLMMNQKNEFKREHINYCEGIITRRLVNEDIIDIDTNNKLFDAVVRTTEQQNNKGNVSSNIRANELSSILLKQEGNSKIKSLKTINFCIVLFTIIIGVAQYITMTTNNSLLQNSILSTIYFNQLQSEMQYLNQYIIYFLNYPPTSYNITQFQSQINQLNNLKKQIAFTQSVSLVYSDSTKQLLYLNFAIDKLVSQANMIRTQNQIINSKDNNVFFISFNVMNDFAVALAQQTSSISQIISENLQQHTKINIIFLIISVLVMFGFILFSNILLNSILKKKTQILQIFFQIPRKTCKNFMKQCQFFIQKIAAQDNDIQMDEIQEDFDTQQNHKQQSKKKKRSIQGQDRTKTSFLIATIIFFMFTCSIQLISLLYYNYTKPNIQNSTGLLSLLSSYELNMIFSLNSINTFFVNKNALIMNAKNSQYSLINLNNTIRNLVNQDYAYQTNFFIEKQKYSAQFLKQYNKIMFSNLSYQTSATYNPDLSHGLNQLAGIYIQNITDKFYDLINYISDPETNNQSKTKSLNSVLLKKQRNNQQIIKYYFRKSVQLLFQQIKKILKSTQNILFGILLSIIFLNLILLYFGWMRFYDLIQKQIMATEYILTFIPIGQINKNPIISNYIINHILSKK